MNQFLKLFSVTTIFILTAFSTHAGDFAKRHIHGFSSDGTLFAFEEYGVQDGSGFPYSNIYVIDTNTDQWTANSPYRVRLDDETKTIFDAREEARILAGPAMKSFEDRGNLVATNQPTERGIDKKRMAAVPRFFSPPLDISIEFRLERIEYPPSDICEPFGHTAGFILTQIATDDGQTTRQIHGDNSVPPSRNCVLDYDLADIVTYYPAHGAPVVAILIFMKSVGFEGPDGRYLAVTTKLSTE